MNNNEEILKRVEATMVDFREGMEATHDLSVRIGKRTTLFLRIFVLCMLILTAVMVYLVYALKDDMGSFVEQMMAMNTHVTQMSQSVMAMQGSTESMASSVKVLPEINRELKGMSQTIVGLDKRIAVIGDQVKVLPVLSSDIAIMTDDFTALLREIREMNSSLGEMSYDMNDISRPMRFFPK